MKIQKIRTFILDNKKFILVGVTLIAFFAFFKMENVQNKSTSVSDNSLTLAEKKISNDTKMAATKQSNLSDKNEVICDISGAIKHEGIYTLKKGARLQELLLAAGGLKANAQVKAINRAIILKDQDKIHIPYKGEKTDNATTIDGNNSTNIAGNQTDDKINLNTASAADLQKLNGIGEKKAEQIINYRDQNGKFAKIEDLMQVSGIGEKTFATLKDQLAI